MLLCGRVAGTSNAVQGTWEDKKDQQAQKGAEGVGYNLGRGVVVVATGMVCTHWLLSLSLLPLGRQSKPNGAIVSSRPEMS